MEATPHNFNLSKMTIVCVIFLFILQILLYFCWIVDFVDVLDGWHCQMNVAHGIRMK